MQLTLGTSGIGTSLVSSGRTATLPMMQQERSPPFSSWAMTAALRQRHVISLNTPTQVGSVEEYREELMISLTSARDLAAESIRKAQERYKRTYDRRATYTTTPLRSGDWVLVHMPQDEAGPLRKLSRPWHGPYRVVPVSDPDALLTKVYFPQDKTIQVNQSRVRACPPHFPSGFYWYGGKRRGPGWPPRWISEVLDSLPTPAQTGDPTVQHADINQSTANESTTVGADEAAVLSNNSISASDEPNEQPIDSKSSLSSPERAPRPVHRYNLRSQRSGRTSHRGE